jgi:mRNA interferase RelE/StbE
MRTLVPERSVLKDLTDLPAKQYRQVVSAIFDLLAEPYPHYAKPLQGSLYWRIAVGEYRVVYRADDEAIFLVAFGKRNDGAVYRVLERKQ